MKKKILPKIPFKCEQITLTVWSASLNTSNKKMNYLSFNQNYFLTTRLKKKTENRNLAVKATQRDPNSRFRGKLD